MPSIAKTIGLAGLSAGVETGVKKLFGKGQTGGFFIKPEMFNYLLPYQHLLTNPQKMDLAKAVQMNSQFHIRQTKTQSGGFLGALLGSIGVPLALNVIKSLTGKGAPQIGAPLPPPKSGKGHQLIQPSPPFVGTWDQIHGRGKKK